MPPNNFQKQVNEFLKRRGLQPTMGDKFPFFDIRKTLFGQMGQTDKFIGSENQNAVINQGLQKAEKNVGVKITPDNIFDVVGAGKPQSFEEVMASSQALQERIKTEGLTKFTPPTTPEEIAAADVATLAGLLGGEGETAPLPQVEPTAPTQAQPIAQAVTGTTPTDLLPEFDPQSLLPTSQVAQLTPEGLAQQALEIATGGATFPLQMEAQQAQKAAVQLQAQRQTQDFIRNIASRGLIFSGAKKRGISQIEADKLADLLNIDRRFALIMVQGIESAMQDIVKEAQKGDENALESLRNIGFDVVNGQVVPTLAARREARAITTEEERVRQFEEREARAERRATETQVRFEVGQERLFTQFQVAQTATQSRFEATQLLNTAKYNLSVAKTQAQIAQANERIRISEERLDLAIQKEARSAIEDQPFLNTNWFVESFGEDVLIKEAKAAGYGEIRLSGKQEMNNYLNDMMRRIESYRQAGYTDKDILKLMQ